MRSVFVLLSLEGWRIWKSRPIALFLFLIAIGPLGFRLLTGEVIHTSGVNSTRSILLGAIIILLAVRGYPVDFECGIFRSLLLQGIQKRHIVIARVLAMMLIPSIVMLPWEINQIFSNKALHLVWIEFGYSVVLDLSISLSFASIFTVAALIGKETFGAVLSVLFYITDLAVFFFTQTSPPILSPDSLGGAGAMIVNLSKYTISSQGLQYSYPEIYGKSYAGIIYFFVFGTVLTLLSILFFDRMELTQ